MFLRWMFFAAILLSAICERQLAAESWGDLTAQFRLDGTAPEAAALKITQDQEFCSRHHVVDESLVVNSQNLGIANVVAFLYLGRSDDRPAIHPDYEATAADEILLDNAKCRFDPHLCLLRTSQILVVGNSDSVGHNCKVDTELNPPFNFTIPANQQLRHRFDLPERRPAPVSCSIHPWMRGYLVVLDHPYMSRSDADGNLQIKGLPVGTWTFQFWHEKLGYLSDVVQNGTPASWRRGRLEVTIKPGVNDLGEIRLTPALFNN